jgi:hypothetical protein
MQNLFALGIAPWAISGLLLVLSLIGAALLLSLWAAKRSTTRKAWAPVLAQEMRKWEAKPWQQLVAELADDAVYEIEFEGKQYQVEVEILERMGEDVHVIVAVDDGSLPASIRPLSGTFIRRKTVSSDAAHDGAHRAGADGDHGEEGG